MPTKFDFLSPGIQLREIDESQLEPVAEHDGILLIGTSRMGPMMKPVKLNSLNDFVDIFGKPADGVKQSDPWRDGITNAPSYAVYAAQAYLASGVGPVKFVRLGGLQLDATTANAAGWTLGSTTSPKVNTNCGAYGLFLAPSSSMQGRAASATETGGTLAAIIYCSSSVPVLRGATPAGDNAKLGAAEDGVAPPSGSAWKVSVGANAEFTMQIMKDDTGATAVTGAVLTVNFDESSPNYIRNVLNTDPTVLNTATQNYKEAGTSNELYFLGETFDVNVSNISGATAGKTIASGKLNGVWLPMTTGSVGWDNFQMPLSASKSAWLLGQRPAQKKLFRLESLLDGTEFQQKYYGKVHSITLPTSINPTARFSLDIMKRSNPDFAVETYSGLTLDSTDSDFIGKRIGTISETWNASQEKFVISGLYPNNSSFVRVELGDDLTERDFPFGWGGPRKIDNALIPYGGGDILSTAGQYLKGGVLGAPLSATTFDLTGRTAQMSGGNGNLTASVPYPTIPLTVASSNRGANFSYSDTFGVWARKSDRLAFNKSYYDLVLRTGPGQAIAPHLTYNESVGKFGVVFAMDDVTGSTQPGGTIAGNGYYVLSGSYDDTDTTTQSITRNGGGASTLVDTHKITRFSFPFFGGSDGTDLRYVSPFNSKKLSDSTSNSPHYSVAQALKMIEDPDYIRYDLLSMPGLCENVLTNEILNIVTNRGDAMAVIDIGQGGGIFRPGFDTLTSNQEASITSMITEIASRQYDTSYAATYYPNVRIKDTLNGNDSVFVAPPSIAAIGAIAQSEVQSQPWFAPAGFNRGGLTRLGGSQGPIVVGAYQHLTKDDRDKLYSTNVNPIARFPATGDTVIFGQKTMQVQQSALDRINVRRLMIFLKKRIGDIANTILFDQNLQATWNRFKTRADAVLSEVKSELGIAEYKLVLDSTTTTPDLVDRNIMYAKIFIKPARAIEFIAIDFVITRSGVEFE